MPNFEKTQREMQYVRYENPTFLDQSSKNNNILPPIVDIKGSDDDNPFSPFTYHERRREAHTAAEQKRRDAIKRGYDALVEIIPMSDQNETCGYKLSKATVLQKSVDYMENLIEENIKMDEERSALRKEVVALQIMQTNYEQMIKSQHVVPIRQEIKVADDVKLQVFQHLIGELFVTFNNINSTSFSELSAGVFSWLEEYCKPQNLKQMIMNVVSRFSSSFAVIDEFS